MGSRAAFVLGVAVVAASIGIQAGRDDSSGSIIQLQLADQLFEESRYEEAIEAYTRAQQIGDQPLKIRAGTGVVKSYLRVADFDRAREQAEALMTMAPKSAEALALNGEALWAFGLFDEAEDAFHRALDIRASEPRARNGVARSLAARSQLEQALTESLAAVQQAPREGDFHHTLGFIYERLHRFEEAAASLGNYVNLLPNKDRSEKAAWARAQIRFLRSFRDRAPIDVSEEVASQLHTIPFRLVRDKVVVKGKVNGGRELDFVLDTGSEMTILSRTAASRAGVTPVTYTLSAGVGEIGLRGLQVGRIDALQVGTLVVTNVPTLIKSPELAGLPTREGEAFSPLSFGLSMMIDYGRQVLIIGRDLPVEPNSIELPLRLHRLAMVRGLLNEDKPASFVVDTGGEVISISLTTASTLSTRPVRHIPLRVYGTSGWDPDAFLLPGIDLAFENVRMDNVAVVVLNLRAPSALLGFQLGGIVGHKFLSQYRAVFDLEKSVLRLTKL